jgi:hypothetical protein
MIPTLSADDIPADIHLEWNPKQSRFLKATEPFVNLEGGVRAGKSYALCWKGFNYAVKYPGIQIALTRWTQDGLDAQLRPEWRRVLTHAGVADRVEWRGDEECDVLPNGSRVYLRALKSSEDTQRYSKLAGLTLAILAIDQAEEVPEDVFRHYVPARLSQKGYPLAVWITPNPPGEDSWIAKDWPETDGKPGHLYIHTTLYDNAEHLGPEVVALQEAGYELGTNEHRRLILGKRGISVAGKPVWGRHFDARRHVFAELEYNPRVFLCEAHDFGSAHPCVVWAQFPPGGTCDLLGGIMGIDLALEDFIPIVEEYRAAWFPGLTMIQQTADPAGAIRNSHGSRTAISILRDFGIYPRIIEDANYPPVKDGALQTVISYLKHSAHDGTPLFRLNPRFVLVSEKAKRNLPVLQTALEGGYTYDPKRDYIGTTYPHLRPPFKDGFYEHPADTLGYLVTAFSPPEPLAAAGIVRNPSAERKARRILREGGFDEAAEPDVRRLAADIVRARQEREQTRLARQELQRAQRDPEPVRWGHDRQDGRGGYPGPRTGFSGSYRSGR